MFYSERKTEDFLEKNKFKIVKRGYASDEKELENVLKKFNFPIVLKISGEKIVHKNRIGGIKINITNFRESLDTFRKFKKIDDFEGVVIQEQIGGNENSSRLGQIKGKEILIGIKKTRDFGHAICVGAGGINTEKLNDVSFRVFPFDGKEAEKMILEIEISKSLDKKERKLVVDNLMKVCKLIKKYPKLSELDINPLIVNKDKAFIVDARMVLD